jgi:hypothetical protein
MGVVAAAAGVVGGGEGEVGLQLAQDIG